MTALEFNRSQIPRAGYEYQDIVAIEFLIAFFQNPGLYEWVELDSDDLQFRHVDDIVAKRKENGGYDLIQVKFTVKPQKYFISINWLTEPKTAQATSLIKKWSTRLLERLTEGEPINARLVTNRPFDESLAPHVSKDGKIDFERLTSKDQAKLASEIGSVEDAKVFFAKFKFISYPHIQLDTDALESKIRETKYKLVPDYTDDQGWLQLKEKVRGWTIYKTNPLPDGRIRHKDLKAVIRKGRPKPLWQNFKVPENYVSPDKNFLDTWRKRIEAGNAVTVLWGLPGQGKSTFLSAFVNTLAEHKLPHARHHYFLSLSEGATDRFSYASISNSLITQMEAFLPSELRPSDSQVDELRSWIIAAANYAQMRSNVFVLIVDGLDHVWREGRSLDQMDHLFNAIIPTIAGYSLICGTQKVEDALLPVQLLRHCPKSSWTQLPALSVSAVEQIVAPRVESKDIQFAINYEHKRNDFVRLLHERCSGNPLVLTYLIEELAQPHDGWSYEAVERLNPANGDGVEGYYSNLWSRLTPGGRQALLLMSSVEFHWPSISSLAMITISCGAEPPGYSIDHLLHCQRTRILPFHGSLLVWIRALDEFKTRELELLTNVSEWLRDNAPEHIRWRWLWIVFARLGQPQNLITESNREWVINSLILGHDISEIMGVLDAACDYAFMASKTEEALRIRSMRTRLSNAEQQTFELPQFEATRRCQLIQDPLTWDRYMDDIRFLDVDVIRDMALRARLRDFDDELKICTEELRLRQNQELDDDEQTWETYLGCVEPVIFAVSLDRDKNLKKICEFIAQNGARERLFEAATNAGTLTGDLEAVIKLSEAALDSKKASTEIIAYSLIKAAAVDGDTLPQFPKLESEPIWVLACGIQGRIIPPSTASVPDVEKVRADNVGMVDRSQAINFFSKSIWLSIACGLADDASIVSVLLDKLPEGQDHEWLRDATQSLLEAGIKIGQRCRVKGNVLSFPDVFRDLERVAPADWSNHHEASRMHYIGFRMALIEASTKFATINQLVRPGAVFNKNDVTIATQSRHWDDELFIELYRDSELVSFDGEAIGFVIQRVLDGLAASVTQFDERTMLLGRLAQLASRHNLHTDTEQLLRRVANCLISYGYRKDFYIWEVVNAVKWLHEVCGVDVREYIKRIAPAVAAVSEYTDRDEVPKIIEKFTRLIKAAAPEWLAIQYVLFVQEEEWSDADDLLVDVLKDFDPSNPYAAALARTAIDTKGPITLAARDDFSGEIMADVRDTIERYASPFQEHDDSLADTQAKDRDPPIEFVPNKFPADAFVTVVELIKTGTFSPNRQEIFPSWVKHWEGQGQAATILETAWDALLDLNLYQVRFEVLTDLLFLSLRHQTKRRAFEWAVKIHRFGSVWGPSWLISGSKSYPFLKTVANNFGHRGFEYIQKVSLGPHDEMTKLFSGPAIGTDKVVFFLTQCGETKAARKYAEEMLSILECELAEQPLQKGVSWIS